MQSLPRGLNILQKISMSLMGVLVLITFIGTNLQAVFWQTSDWLVSTVLPATVVNLTNKERAQNSAPPLHRNATLDAAAKLKAEDMSKNQYFAHFSPTGVSPWHWFDQAGYVYAHAGENLAIHFTDSSEVVEAWMKSPTHRQNIVNGLYTEIGVGTAKGKYDGYDTVYVVQLFGTPALAPVPVSPAPEPEPTVALVETPAPQLVSEMGAEPAEAVSVAVAPPALPTEEELGAEVEASAPAPTPAPKPAEVNELAVVSTENRETAPLRELDLVEASTAPAHEAVLAESTETVSTKEVVMIETSLLATSSGLAIANIITPNNESTGVTAVAIATQPNALLQIIYLILGTIVFLLLGISIVVEARRLHYRQVAYGVMLLGAMGGLWFINSLLTAGAVII